MPRESMASASRAPSEDPISPARQGPGERGSTQKRCKQKKVIEGKIAGVLWQKICLLMWVMQKVQVRSLGWEDALEVGMATHSNILAWRIPQT